jgi:DNA-binding PadR family transcriptional regulator
MFDNVTTKEIAYYILKRSLTKPVSLYQIQKQMRNDTHLKIPNTTLYRTLFHLERVGYIKLNWDTSKNRPVKHIIVTSSGKNFVKETYLYWTKHLGSVE